MLGKDFDKAMKKALEGLRLRQPVEVDEGKLREDARRADKAKKLLADEDLKRAFEVIEGVYMNLWSASDALDVERREKCWCLIQAIRALKGYLSACVEKGDAAERTMEKIARQQ